MCRIQRGNWTTAWCALIVLGAASIAGATPYSDYAITTLGASHYYNLNEAANSTTISDTGNATAINGTTSFGTGGNLGVAGPNLPGLGGLSNTAFNANGNSHINLNADMPSADMTVALWFQILSGGEFQRLFTNDNIAQDAANVGEYFSLIYDTTGNFSEAGPGLHVTARRSGPNASGKRLLKSALNLEDGLWHHVVVAGDGTGVISTFVVDGVDVLGSTVTAVQNLSHPPQARIGSRDGGAAANTFNGHIDDIAVWLGTQLSVGQAQSLYNAALIPEPASAILMLFGLSALGIFRRRARAIGVRR